MSALEVLSNSASRRGVLRTGVKAAYVTPLVLASVHAVPAFASPAGADISEDKVETSAGKASQVLLTGQWTALYPTLAAAKAAASATADTYLNDFVILTNEVVAPASQGTTDIFAGTPGYSTSFLYTAFTFHNAIVPGFGATLPSRTVTTVTQAIQYLNLLIGTLKNAIAAFDGSTSGADVTNQDLLNISSILNIAPPPIQTQGGLGVEDDFEQGLTTLAAGSFS